MRVLITGGSGFIGGHLAERLIEQGRHVTVLDDLSTGSPANIAHLEGNPRFRFLMGSVLDESLMDRLVEQNDVVFHLAAAVGVELVVRNPLTSLTTNIRGSEVVLNAACRYRRKVLVTSTSEIYGKNANGPLCETDDRILGSPLKSRWAYSTSKAVDEILAYFYWKEKGLPTVIVRLFNTVGPRQSGSYGMVVPRFVGQALRGDPLTIHGDGSQTRCFLHVFDTVSALVALMDHPQAAGDVFNVGSQEEVTVRELAQRVIAATGSPSGISFIPYEDAYEDGFEDMSRRVPDIGKIAALIGFRPTRNLDDILSDVIRELRERPAAGHRPPRS